MTHLAIIADDLTGAADTGVAFASRLVTLINFSFNVPPADVLVFSTESRAMSPEDAYTRARCATKRVTDAHWVYKKMDSTLRGNPAAELQAVLTVLGEGVALVAPAFPAQGRTTVGGRQYVDGLPLEQTPFAREGATSDLGALFSPVAETRLLGLDVVRAPSSVLQQQMVNRPERESDVTVARPVVWIADAETEADLEAIAAAALSARVRVWCGAAGLARVLVKRLPCTATAPPPTVPPAPQGVVLVVAGSQQSRTQAQIEFARAYGVTVVPADARLLTSEATAGIAATVAAIRSHLAQDLILTTAGLAPVPLAGKVIAERLAAIVRQVVMQGGVGKLVLTGGDVAAAVCRALEADALWLRGEIEPGVPHGILLGGVGAGMPVVTKAGGFGNEQTLVKAMELK